MDDIETLDKIRDMLLEGYRKASENFKARTEGQKIPPVRRLTAIIPLKILSMITAKNITMRLFLIQIFLTE